MARDAARAGAVARAGAGAGELGPRANCCRTKICRTFCSALCRAAPLSDRASLDLSRTSARRDNRSGRARAPCGRCRAHQQSARRHGNERRHPRRVQSRRQARRDLCRRRDALLDRYVRQRRTVAVEAVQQQTNRNHQILSERDPDGPQEIARCDAPDRGRPGLAREYMLKSSMIGGLRRAAEIQ